MKIKSNVEQRNEKKNATMKMFKQNLWRNETFL